MSTEAAEVAVPLDHLLTQAVSGPAGRLLPGRSGLRFLGALAQRPGRGATRLGDLVGELGKIAIGASNIAPARRDRRFADPAWTGSALLKRIMQAYLATGAMAEGLVQDVPMGWRQP